jgi:nucleoid-associated protein YgaU
VAPAAVQTRVFKVRSEETIFDVARYELKNPARWSEIYALNRQALVKPLDPLRVGTELKIPVR